MTSCDQAQAVPLLSIIVPVYNEAMRAFALLRLLAPLRRCGVELIVVVVGGGSSDNRRDIALRLAPRVLGVPDGRVLQFNVAAAFARGTVLLSLPRGVMLPSLADQLVDQAMSRSGWAWGCFGVRFYGGWRQRLRSPWLRLRALSPPARIRRPALSTILRATRRPAWRAQRAPSLTRTDSPTKGDSPCQPLEPLPASPSPSHSPRSCLLPAPYSPPMPGCCRRPGRRA